MRIDRKDNLKMMQTPDGWPIWPLLPVKKWRASGHDWDCALLFADGQPVVIKADMYRLDQKPGSTYAEKFAGCERIGYLSFEAMIDDGWEVD